MRKGLLGLGWLYIAGFLLWLALRLGFSDRLWALLAINSTVDYLFLPLPLLVLAAWWLRSGLVLIGLLIPTIALVSVLALTAWSALIRPETKPALEVNKAVADTLLVCGWDEVYALKLATLPQPPTKVWSWRARSSAGMPPLMVTKFATTDECKPLDSGSKILITSSTNGVALVEQTTGKTLFYASVPGAHSADRLPRDRLAIAGAESPLGGHTLELYDLKQSGRRLWQAVLYSGHGVYYDASRNVVWALGRYELREYTLVDWESDAPSLMLKRSFSLPSPGGHDLSPTPDRKALLVTTDTDVVVFDLQSNQFTQEPRLARQPLVKGVDIHPITQRVVYIQAGGGKWWSSQLQFLNPKQTLSLDNERLYKARWLY